MSENTNLDKKNSETIYCSFCAKSQYEVRKIVAHDHHYICGECVDICSAICREDDVKRLAERIARPIISAMRYLRTTVKAQEMMDSHHE